MQGSKVEKTLEPWFLRDSDTYVRTKCVTLACLQMPDTARMFINFRL